MMILATLIMIRIIKKLKFLNLISIMVNGRSLSFGSSNLLYNFGIIILLLKEENRLSTLPIWYIDKFLNKFNLILKNFLKRIKIKKNYLLILIDFETRSALPLVLPIIKNTWFVLLRLYNRPFQYLNILYVSKNIPFR